MPAEMYTAPIKNIKTMPGTDARSSPRKWVPYGFKQNNSPEFTQNRCIFADCTVVGVDACLNVFVLAFDAS